MQENGENIRTHLTQTREVQMENYGNFLTFKIGVADIITTVEMFNK